MILTMPTYSYQSKPGRIGISCLLFLTLFLCANSQPVQNMPSSQNTFNQIFQPNKGGVFRGIYFNLNKDQIKAHEFETHIYAEDTNFVVYTVYLNSKESEFADIYYDFDEKGLYSINIETYLEQDTSADNLFKAASRFFTTRYGAGATMTDGYTVWKTVDNASGMNYEIAIINVSSREDAGLMFELYVID